MKSSAARCLALLLLLAAYAFAGDEEVEEALAVIRSSRTLDDFAVGEGADTTPVYRAFERLRDSADAAKLEKLTKDRNPIVRCYAVRALAEAHPEADLSSILLAHLGDTANVTTFRGCIQDEEMVGDVMLFEAWGRLSVDQLRTIALRSWKEDSKLAFRVRSLHDVPFRAEDRPLLLKIEKGGEPAALVALARLGNAEDLALIRNRLRWESTDSDRLIRPVLSAVSAYPDPSLIPDMNALEPAVREYARKTLPGRLWPWFKALAAFESPRTAEVLLGFLDPKSESAREFAVVVSDAVVERRVPAHVPVYVKLWLEHQIMSPEIFAFLSKQEPVSTRKRAREFIDGDLGSIHPDTIVALFKYVSEDDRAGAVTALAVALKRANVNTSNALARVAAEWKKPEFVEPLFEILTTQSNPNLYLGAARALLRYDAPEIDDRLHVAVMETPALRKGWGGERLKKLLEE